MSEATREDMGRVGDKQEGAEGEVESRGLDSRQEAEDVESKRLEFARGAREQDFKGLDFRRDSRQDSKGDFKQDFKRDSTQDSRRAYPQRAQAAQVLDISSKGGKLGRKSQAEIESIKSCVLGDSPFAYTLSLISGKYKMSILYALYRFEVVRYNELKRFLETISFKSLTNTLRELESDGLILRKEYPQIPPRVEYSLSERGRSLIPILNALCTWGQEHRGS